MSRTFDECREAIDGDDEYRKKRQEDEDQYYIDLMEQMDQIEKMDLDVTESSEEELFNQLLRDEREESLDPQARNKIGKELKKRQ